jgi:hypothetical protein
MLQAERSGVRIPLGAKTFVFSKTSRTALGRNQPPMQLIPLFFFTGKAAGA